MIYNGLHAVCAIRSCGVSAIHHFVYPRISLTEIGKSLEQFYTYGCS